MIGVIALVVLIFLLSFAKTFVTKWMMHRMAQGIAQRRLPLQAKWKNATMEQIMKFDWAKADKENPLEKIVVFERMAQLEKEKGEE